MQGVTNDAVVAISDNDTFPEARVQFWRERYDAGKKCDLIENEPDPVVVGSLFKLWLRELPEPLIPVALSSSLMAVEDENMTHEERCASSSLSF